MHIPRLVLLLSLALGAGSGPVWAQSVKGTFQVNITLTKASSSSCATLAGNGLAGAGLRIACLTSDTPVFRTPGRPDITTTNNFSSGRFETAGQVPSIVAVSGLAVSAGGTSEVLEGEEPEIEGLSDAATNGRRLRGATFEVPPGARPLEEIEVSF